MTASFFHTILAADVRTNPHRPGVQFAASMSESPRWSDLGSSGGWANGYLKAEDVLHVAAQSIADTAMTGETGDHPDKRQQVVAILDATAAAVRTLAMDANGNSALSEEKWQAAIEDIARALTEATPDPQGRRAAHVEVIDFHRIAASR